MIASKQEMAILFKGSTDSLAVYTLAALGKYPDVPSPRMIHLLCIQNGASSFQTFPFERFKTAAEILKKQVPAKEPLPEGVFIELDATRLFKGLWIDQYEQLMPQYNGKNLVCVACGLAMHARALIYCVERLVPMTVVGYSGNTSCCSKLTEAFMTQVAALSSDFGITTRFLNRSDFSDERVIQHLLEDHGLPSDNGGERRCMFSQTLSTAADQEIENYLGDMLPHVSRYVESRIEGRIRDAAECFAPGKFMRP